MFANSATTTILHRLHTSTESPNEKLKIIFSKCPSEDTWRKYTNAFNLPEKNRRWIVMLCEHLISMNDDSHNAANAFLETEMHLKVRQGFWIAIGLVYRAAGSADPRWKDAFERNYRMLIDRDERIRLTSILCLAPRDVRAYPWLYSYAAGYIRRTDSPLRVYRGFWANDKAQIRVSHTQGDDGLFDAKRYQQLDGAGYSYSLSKVYAQNLIAPKYSPTMIKRYAGLSESDALIAHSKIIATIKSYWLDQIYPKVVEFNLRPILGIYEIEKKDVVTFFPNEEEEIIATNNVRLLRYEPITYCDAHAAQTLLNMVKDFNEYLCVHNADQRLLLHTLSQEKLLTKLKNGFKSFAKNPQQLKEEVLKDIMPVSKATLTQLDLCLTPPMNEVDELFRTQLRSQGCHFEL